MDDDGNFPTATDVLAEILARLPPNARRRLRLVCRLWRAVVDQRTATDMRARGKILAVTTSGTAYVVDAPSPGRPTVLSWPTRPADRAAKGRLCDAMSIVGTCNGIVCLCDDWMPGGAIRLANPSTGEALDLPPLPLSAAAVKLLGWVRGNWHQTYTFVFHPTTGQYKVVHVPSHFDPSICWEPGTVHVFTLGEAWWRDVHAAGPNARCALGACHFADVDGTVYWMTEYTGRVVSLDLEDESVKPVEPLPVAGPGDCWLTKVHGRLGVVVGGGDDSVAVWVLEGERWSCRYVVETRRLSQKDERLRWELTRPHFAHGDYVLTHGGSGKFMCGRKMNEAGMSHGGAVQIRRNDRVDAVLCRRYRINRTFAYIETMEPLSVYAKALVTNSGSIGSQDFDTMEA